MTTIPNNSLKGLSNDNTNSNSLLNNRENNSIIDLHEDENNRKSYPQRNNRTKLNYRDIERGMYEEIRQSMWNLTGSTLINKNNQRSRDKEVEIIDLSVDDDDDDDDKKSMDDNDQTHRRLWCICKKPWDHSRLMLRCDSCANWYHGDCIGISREQAKTLEINGDSFICPSCRVTKLPEESILIKQKRSDILLSTNDHNIRENQIRSKSISYNVSRKDSKSNILEHRDSLIESSTNCIVHSCNNPAKSGWVYCSPGCIRRHINDTLQSIQRNKGMNNEEIPTSNDILLYESKNKKFLEKNLVPKIEDLCVWINQHPSYELIKPSPKQTIVLTKKQSKDLIRPVSTNVTTTKSKLLSISTTVNKKLSLNELKKPINNANTTADIRSKVPTALYDKILMRLEKNGEKDFIKQNILTIVNQIEEEMFRVYNKVDNSYKNKFRSLLANISNMNNNFFYKQILSKEITAKQIVAMKSEDMLPPEEKEKRKDQFEREIEMIINAEEQNAEEMARRVRMKVTRQGLIDNDSLHLSIFTSKEQSSLKEESEKSKDNQSSKKNMEVKSTSSKSVVSSGSDKQAPSLSLPATISSTSTSLINKLDPNQPSKLPIVEQSNPVISAVDHDNDYIEPESPTGIDALIYDEDDNDDTLNNTNISSHSPVENTEFIAPYQPVIRDDYNPSKAKNEIIPISQPTPIISLSNQWHGIIQPPDTKIPCQSLHVYGESDYLIKNIPEQLVILGRLRLGDLWDYIRDSITVRDVLILTLISSPLNTNDNEIFSQYVDTMRTLGRAAVISKCTNTSLIRDMYILAADTKECPSNVLSSLFLPMIFESKQLFLVIIGSGKRTMKTINRPNENQLLNNLIYTPVALQDSTVTRDPRLLKHKDPRLNKSNITSENITTIPTPQSSNTKQTSVQYSNEDLIKLISDSLERIRRSSTSDAIRSIVMSTTEILKGNKRDDLCTSFNESLRLAMTEWQTKHGNTSISTPSIVIDDNLTEENMDVDDDQDDKHKKQITTSSNSNLSSEFNDIDYRFLNQDMDDQIKKTNEMIDHRKQRRKSRFSDLLPTDIIRAKKSKLTILNEEEKSTAKHIHSSLTNKFRPMINSIESCSSSINTKDHLISNPIRFSFSKDTYRRYKSNTPSTTNIYGNFSKFPSDLTKEVQSYNSQDSSFSNDNWIKQPVLTNSIRSTPMLNLTIQQQKIKNRFSSTNNEWRSSSNYTTHYHDFDQPQE